VYDSNPHGLAHKLITLNPYLARVEPKFIHSASLIPSRRGRYMCAFGHSAHTQDVDETRGLGEGNPDLFPAAPAPDNAGLTLPTPTLSSTGLRPEYRGGRWFESTAAHHAFRNANRRRQPYRWRSFGSTRKL
jgi:hypothetical protein